MSAAPTRARRGRRRPRFSSSLSFLYPFLWTLALARAPNPMTGRSPPRGSRVRRAYPPRYPPSFVAAIAVSVFLTNLPLLLCRCVSSVPLSLLSLCYILQTVSVSCEAGHARGVVRWENGCANAVHFPSPDPRNPSCVHLLQRTLNGDVIFLLPLRPDFRGSSPRFLRTPVLCTTP